jgi:hypothetical protein
VQTTRDYSVGDLINKLALMAMLHALPHKEYTDSVSLLTCQKDLSCANVKAASQVKQTEHNTHHGPLLSPSGKATLHTAAQPPRQNKLGVKCGFCPGEGHNEENCYKKDHARKDAQKAVQEHHANRDTIKPHRTNRATATSPSSPVPSNSAKVTKLAASASVHLAGSPDTHADAHWIADTGATSHMSPCHSWFTKLEPLAIPISVANDPVMCSSIGKSAVTWPARWRWPALASAGQADQAWPDALSSPELHHKTLLCSLVSFICIPLALRCSVFTKYFI